MEKANTEKKIEMCNKCSYKGRKYNVTRHKESHHKQCPYCDYETEHSKININDHIKENHPDFDTLDDSSYPSYPTYICTLGCSKRVPQSYWKKHNKIKVVSIRRPPKIGGVCQ